MKLTDSYELGPALKGEMLERVYRRSATLRRRRRTAIIAALLPATIALVMAVLPDPGRLPSIALHRISPEMANASGIGSVRPGSFPTPFDAQGHSLSPPRPEDCSHLDVTYSPEGQPENINAYARHPACGPVRFDPEPKQNQAMKVSLEVEPATPRAGQEVLFRITAEDADALINDGCYDAFYGEGIGGPTCGTSQAACPAFFGLWKPPTQMSDRHAISISHVYEEPGDYTATFLMRSGSGYLPICGFPNPYSDVITVTVKLVVLP